MSTNKYLRDMLYSALFAALIAVLGLIAIPVSFLPAPITGQTLGVMLAGAILTTRQTALGISTFLALGIAGVPVFALGQGGLSILGGPRGGFLIGFLIGGIVITLLRGKSNNVKNVGISCLIGGVLVIYAIGIPWMSYSLKGSLFSIPVFLSSIVYVPFDIVKVFIASWVSVKVRKQLPHLATS